MAKRTYIGMNKVVPNVTMWSSGDGTREMVHLGFYRAAQLRPCVAVGLYVASGWEGSKFVVSFPRIPRG